MPGDTALSTAVKTHFASTTGRLTRFTTAWSTELKNAADEFNLAPDYWIDIKRIPATVTDLPTLLTYLRLLKDEISNPRADTATSGRLKLYKLIVCMIHALNSYLATNPPFGVSAAVFVTNAMAHGLANPPQGLSENGTKMWTATFDAANIRAQHCMALLVAFGDNEARSAQPAGVGP
jgi:hypothetical protein